MENASKALIMAAGILIGVLILSLTVYLFVTFGETSKQIHTEIDINRLNEFNAQFTSYETKDDNTIYDIISVANLARENNEYYDLKLEGQSNGNFYIRVDAKLKSGNKTKLEQYNNNTLQDLAKFEINNMKEETDSDGTIYKKLPTYSCNVTINNQTKRVNMVEFTPN